MEKIPLSTINPIIIKISSIKNIKVFSVGKYSRMFKESKREAKVLNSFNENNPRTIYKSNNEIRFISR